MNNAVKALQERLLGNKQGSGKGVYSVCSSHPAVIEAAAQQAKLDNSLLIVESTSNQVDQFGGYTGMKPEDFVRFVLEITQKTGIASEQVLLGGDHLGPNVWQNEAAESAMDKARELVRAYAKAGYQKIHLDASMLCAGDTNIRGTGLGDEIAAARAADLCRACEDAAADRQADEKPLYIIGTEVPIPGGTQDAEDAVQPTPPKNVQTTLEISKQAFYKKGLQEAWQRVIAIVAQPGVEFGDNQVFYYQRENALALSHALDDEKLVFEAHSTDYQSASCLRRLVQDHFCILKVGPWLTYSWREALFALEHIESELICDKTARSDLSGTIEQVMFNAQPDYWRKYYRGSQDEQRQKRRFSFSDRVRYYWANKTLDSAVQKLFCNLRQRQIPLSLVSQYMNAQFMQLSEGLVRSDPYELALARVRETLAFYARASGW
ncbi:MAG: class II D-tagatose-bisphosphate aldolase, non-catalytic subunit [Spirochaetaceae bacterium]|jgi:D-tagatose-1,6-bisphosphate aldolase subunit GatZ/KbaZ|nr:class II D-tagatose-bisphosphate aldolase, non-catalytic subunit [Spirochaetaceae bacterium]